MSQSSLNSNGNGNNGNGNNDLEKNVSITELVNQEAILAAMKCNICGITPGPPIAHCSGKEGHLICKECAEKEHTTVPFGHCPARLVNHVLCRSAIIPYGMKLFDILYYGSFMTCPYSRRGCKDKFLGSARETHLTTCQFRPQLPCPVMDCKSVVSSRLFTKHLTSSHKIMVIEGNKAVVHVLHERKERSPTFKEHARWIPVIFSFKGLDFLLVVEETDKRLYLWVLSANPTEVVLGRHFNARLKMKTPAGKRSVSWSGDVCTLDCNMDAARESENCLSVLKTTVENDYLFQDGGYWYFLAHVIIDEYIIETYLDDGPGDLGVEIPASESKNGPAKKGKAPPVDVQQPEGKSTSSKKPDEVHEESKKTSSKKLGAGAAPQAKDEVQETEGKKLSPISPAKKEEVAEPIGDGVQEKVEEKKSKQYSKSP